MLLCNSKQDMTIPTIGKYNIIVPGILYVSMAVHTLHVLSQTVKIKTATNMIRLAFLYFCKMSSPQRFPTYMETSRNYVTGNSIICTVLYLSYLDEDCLSF